MRKLYVIVLCVLYFSTVAQSPEGIWVTIDDETNEPKSHIKIYKENGKYFGKVLELLPAARTSVCLDCPGDMKGKSLKGMILMKDLVPYQDYYSYGTIVDPRNGNEYKCSMWLVGNKLHVRGYIGFSAIGRTQIWEKLNEKN